MAKGPVGAQRRPVPQPYVPVGAQPPFYDDPVIQLLQQHRLYVNSDDAVVRADGKWTDEGGAVTAQPVHVRTAFIDELDLFGSVRIYDDGVCMFTSTRRCVDFLGNRTKEPRFPMLQMQQQQLLPQQQHQVALPLSQVPVRAPYKSPAPVDFEIFADGDYITSANGEDFAADIAADVTQYVDSEIARMQPELEQRQKRLHDAKQSFVRESMPLYREMAVVEARIALLKQWRDSLSSSLPTKKTSV